MLDGQRMRRSLRSLADEFFPEEPSRKFDNRQDVLFFSCLVLHVVIWSLVPTVSGLNLRVDVIEGLFWGREWQLGYYKHPPMAAWLLEAAVSIFGKSDFITYLMPQLGIAVVFCSVWVLARDFVTNQAARILSVLLLELNPFFTILGFEFNPNTVILPFLALSVLFLWKAAARGKKRDWFFLGLFSGLSLYGKYVSGVFLVAEFLFLVGSKSQRKHWSTGGPYIALVTCCLVFFPHAVWVIENEFATITYAVARATADEVISPLTTHFVWPLRFVGEQILIVIPTALFCFALWRATGRATRRLDPLRRDFLAAVVLGPAILFALMSAVVGWKVLFLWEAPLLMFLPMACMAVMDVPQTRRVWRSLVVMPVICAVLAGAYWLATPYIERMGFPGRQLAERVFSAWQTALPGQPLRYVIGSERYQGWIPGNVAYYLPQKERPSVWLEFNPRYSPWMDHEKLRTAGGVVVWQGRDTLPAWAARFLQQHPDLRVSRGGTIELSEKRKGKDRRLLVNLLFVLPTQA